MIDEKEVLKILKRYEGRMNPTAYFGLEADIVNIEKYAEPKTGHWIGTRRVGCGFGEYKEYIVSIKDGIVTDSCHCSECGEWLTGSDEYECYGNYCPNCGADMRGGRA